MPRPAPSKSPAFDALAAAKETLKAATTAINKNRNEKTSEAYQNAKAAVLTAQGAANHERFIQYTNIRVSRILEDISTFSDCSNTKTYAYAKEEVDRAFAAIEQAIGAARMKFTAGLDGLADSSALRLFKL